MAVRVCSSCSAETAEDSGRFCPACGQTLVDADELADTAATLVGTVVDGFEIESVIGGGSFGTVYKGRQLTIDRPVALKVPTHAIAADPVMTQRFAREARAAARINHPGIVSIYAVGALPDGRPYLAMEFVDGRPLDQILSGGPVRATRALRIARQIASALSDTHAASVIHRDLKPSNIIWRRDRNGDDRITIVDFGIAVSKPGTAEATRLTAGGLIGTPHYMSPEQAHGEEVDGRADLYALGCILFELVTRTTPFDGSGYEVLLAHMGKSVPPPSERGHPLKIIVPPSVDKLVVKLLQKRPPERPASADAVVALIDDALEAIEGPSASPRSSRAKRPTRAPVDDPPAPVAPPRRRWPMLVAGALVVLGGGGFAAWHFTGTDVRELDGPTRVIPRDSGDLEMTMIVPEEIAARTPVEMHISLRNKLGQPVDASGVAIMVEDVHEIRHGYSAVPVGQPGHFHFDHTFIDAGRYHLQIFTSPPDTRFDVDLDVE